MVKFRFAVSSEDGIQKLKDRIIKVESPSWMIWNFRHLDDGFYGEITDNAIWIQKYDNEFVQSGFPKRYFDGRIIKAEGKTIIEGRFRFSSYYYAAYAIMAIVLTFIVPTGGFGNVLVPLIIFCVFSVVSGVIGALTCKKYESAVIDFLKSL